MEADAMFLEEALSFPHILKRVEVQFNSFTEVFLGILECIGTHRGA